MQRRRGLGQVEDVEEQHEHERGKEAAGGQAGVLVEDGEQKGAQLYRAWCLQESGDR